MALQSSLVTTALSLTYKDGVDSTGKDIIRAKKYSNVKISASNEELYETAAALAPLMKYEPAQILRSDESFLMNL